MLGLTTVVKVPQSHRQRKLLCLCSSVNAYSRTTSRPKRSPERSLLVAILSNVLHQRRSSKKEALHIENLSSPVIKHIRRNPTFITVFFNELVAHGDLVAREQNLVSGRAVRFAIPENPTQPAGLPLLSVFTLPVPLREIPFDRPGKPKPEVYSAKDVDRSAD